MKINEIENFFKKQEYQGNQKLVLWKKQQNWQTFSWIDKDKKREESGIKNKKEKIIINFIEIKRIIKDRYEQMCINIDNLEEIEIFLEKHKLPKLIKKKQTIWINLQVHKIK